MTNWLPGWVTTLPVALFANVTLDRIALPRIPLIARMPEPLRLLVIRTFVIRTSGTTPPPFLNWMPS